MNFTKDPNDRRRVDGQTQRNRDAEVARLRSQSVPFRTIASRSDMSLGQVQKSLRRAQKLSDVLAGGQPGDVLVVALDDELKAADVACVEDIDRLSELEYYRLRHTAGEFGDIVRSRPWPY